MRKLLLVLLLALAACGQAPTPLEVTNVYPPDGYHGFTKSDDISIEFNRPISLDSFVTAYRSTSDGLRPEEIAFSLQDGGRKLVIHPAHPLLYSPNEDYLYYGFELGSEMRGLNGERLSAPLEVSFTTMRTLTTSLLCESALDGSATQTTVENDGVALFVGDNVYDAPVRSFLAFAWPEQSDGVIAAQLRLPLAAAQNSPMADLGPLYIEPVDLGEALEVSDFSASALADPLSEDGSGWAGGNVASYDVGDWAQQAWEDGRPRLDLRLRFATESDGDGVADALAFFAREAEDTQGAGSLPTLELTYYGP
ncbi:Ig-like domain-containing protein [Oceanithermus sp.]